MTSHIYTFTNYQLEELKLLTLSTNIIKLGFCPENKHLIVEYIQGIYNLAGKIETKSIPPAGNRQSKE